MSIRHWTPEEDATLAEYTALRISAKEIGLALGRSGRSIRWRRQHLGLQFLRPLPKVVPRPSTPVADIQAVVASHFKLTIGQLKSRARASEICRPRQVGMFLAHDVARRSYTEIGRRFGRDHTTVIHAVRQIERMCSENSDFASEINELSCVVRRGHSCG